MSRPGSNSGVKAIIINRERIKERMQQRQLFHQQQTRRSQLSAVREMDEGRQSGQIDDASSSTNRFDTSPSLVDSAGQGRTSGESDHVAPEWNDWKDIGSEFGVDVYDAEVWECLLALEEEIRQEQLFQLYDQANGNEWDEYYRSLQ